MSGMSISGRRSSRSAPTSRTRSRCGSTVMSGQSARPARPGSGSARARAVNRRLLDTERVGQGCVLASPAFERIARPTLTEDGRKTPALRFGDLRVQALAGALCTTMLAVTGITNKSLRALMTGLLDGHRLHHEPGQLRPHTVTPQRPDHPHPGPQPVSAH